MNTPKAPPFIVIRSWTVRRYHWFCWRMRLLKSWVLWLPHRKLRTGLYMEFSAWGPPLETLKAMSIRLERTDKSLAHAYEEWGKCEKRARHAELMLASERISPEAKETITRAWGVSLDDQSNN